jgi:DNA-binding MarR family transcriptional regulator/GNAT superfamily N-acetyltransferase
MDMAEVTLARVAAVRRFNRFWTRAIGALQLHSPFSLTEARVLYELSQHDVTDAAELGTRLDIDQGYLSRVLARFRKMRLVTTAPSRKDKRRRELRVTSHGRTAFAGLDARSSEQVGEVLSRLDEAQQRRLVGAMQTIHQLFEEPTRPTAWSLRPPVSGDLGWVVERHGILYAREYGWDARFEALVAGVVAEFGAAPSAMQQAWIAEADGERVGCVFCMRKDERTAQLRLLLVQPGARGLGIGGRLIDECVRFARSKGYRRLVLWTNSVLEDARRLYERAGFVLEDEEPHDRFGEGLIGQTWALQLTAGTRPSTRSRRSSK